MAVTVPFYTGEPMTIIKPETETPDAKVTEKNWGILDTIAKYRWAADVLVKFYPVYLEAVNEFQNDWPRIQAILLKAKDIFAELTASGVFGAEADSGFDSGLLQAEVDTLTDAGNKFSGFDGHRVKFLVEHIGPALIKYGPSIIPIILFLI